MSLTDNAKSKFEELQRLMQLESESPGSAAAAKTTKPKLMAKPKCKPEPKSPVDEEVRDKHLVEEEVRDKHLYQQIVCMLCCIVP